MRNVLGLILVSSGNKYDGVVERKQDDALGASPYKIVKIKMALPLHAHSVFFLVALAIEVTSDACVLISPPTLSCLLRPSVRLLTSSRW